MAVGEPAEVVGREAPVVREPVERGRGLLGEVMGEERADLAELVLGEVGGEEVEELALEVREGRGGHGVGGGRTGSVRRTRRSG